jgi:hypothetical protein
MDDEEISLNKISKNSSLEAQRAQRKAGWFYPIEREPDWKKDAALRGKTGSKSPRPSGKGNKPEKP